MHMYMYISVSIYLCSGTISQKKYETNSEYIVLDTTSVTCCFCKVFFDHPLFAQDPCQRAICATFGTTGWFNVREMCTLFLVLIFNFAFLLRLQADIYFPKCKNKKDSYSTLIENLLSSIQGSRCQWEVVNTPSPEK